MHAKENQKILKRSPSDILLLCQKSDISVCCLSIYWKPPIINQRHLFWTARNGLILSISWFIWRSEERRVGKESGACVWGVAGSRKAVVAELHTSHLFQ